MRSRVYSIVLAFVVAVIDTGSQGTAWRQCLAHNSGAAIQACTSIITVDSHNDGALVNRGIAFRRAGDTELALRDYDAAIRLNPGAADAFNNRGNALRAQRDLPRAMDDYNEAIRLDPHYAHAFNNRGIIFLELGEVEQAIEDFDRAIAEDPLYANAFRSRALARMEQGLFDLALTDLDAAFRLNPAIGHGIEYELALQGRRAQTPNEDWDDR